MAWLCVSLARLREVPELMACGVWIFVGWCRCVGCMRCGPEDRRAAISASVFSQVVVLVMDGILCLFGSSFFILVFLAATQWQACPAGTYQTYEGQFFCFVRLASLKCTNLVIVEVFPVQPDGMYVCVLSGRLCADVGARICLLWACWCVWMMPNGPCQSVSAVPVRVGWLVVRLCGIVCVCFLFFLGALVS
jgi:hypothetical protein